MGAAHLVRVLKGRTLNEAFDKGRKEAEEEFGYDAYNGEFNGFHYVQDVTGKFKASGKTLEEFVREWEDMGGKGDCFAVCMEEPKASTAKIKSKVDHIVEKGTKKWVLKYCVQDTFFNSVSSHDTKGDAVKAARAYTEKTRETTRIVMEKRLEKGSSVVAKVVYKFDKSEKLGKWVFFGKVMN